MLRRSIYLTEAERFRGVTQEDQDADLELAANVKRARAEAEAHPMSEAAQRGRDLFFGKAGGKQAECKTCHMGPNLADELFYNLWTGMEQEKPDIGRKEVTKEKEDLVAFPTEGLTGPLPDIRPPRLP